jgi:mono/diheme cytochrome c family protein
VSRLGLFAVLPGAAALWLALAGIFPGGASPAARAVAAPKLLVPAYTVTPVSGPSRIHQLGLVFADTALGRAGRFGTAADALPLQGQEVVAGPFELSGADLYRLNCRSCHEDNGQGMPPEIHSVIPPVQGASPAWLAADFTRRGFPVNDQFLASVTSGAEHDLRDRLINGGKEMPPFAHLQGPEIDALLGYLRTLAQVPEAPKTPVLVREDICRVGEHIVKGTCHTCHDATGPDVDAAGLAAGEIPSLASFPRRFSILQVMHKVREGKRITIGLVSANDRGRMPVFSYLTPTEVQAAYIYLSLFPPKG